MGLVCTEKQPLSEGAAFFIVNLRKVKMMGNIKESNADAVFTQISQPAFFLLRILIEVKKWIKQVI